MIYPMVLVLFPVILSDTLPRFQGHSVIFMHIDALSILCAQLTLDLLAIAKFLYGIQLRLDVCFVDGVPRMESAILTLSVCSSP